jgi:hypothetical protein
MSDFRKLAHLWVQLGEERFQALISSDNTGKVKEFCDGLLKSAIPTELTNIGPEKRTYDMLSYLRGDEKSVVGHTMVERAVEMNANLGEGDGQYLLDNQQDIPVALRGKVVFVFTGWRHPDNSEDVYYVYWSVDRWVRDWHWIVCRWDVDGRVLRRK